MKAVIMAGGKGTRFWPKSTPAKPKQFLTLTSEKETMLQQTYGRFRHFLAKEDIYFVVGVDYADMVKEQLPEVGSEQIILEPAQRDTAPCIALAARYFLRRNEDEVIITAPSDQYVDNPALFAKAMLAAEAVARQDAAVVTLGIVPTRAETGYGYIEVADAPDRVEGEGFAVKRVRSFIEKPDKDKAERLLLSQGVYWNSGIFVWKPSTIAHYMKMHRPEIWKIAECDDGEWDSLYRKLDRISIDYAIMEKVDRMYMIPVRFIWDDVGVWTSLERIFDLSAEGNLLSGNIHYANVDNSIIMSDSKKTIVIGVKDLIVVSTSEGLLICKKSEEQRIKPFLE
ncbi:mannose-1-phosphate guanylyltransferase [Paenibacillus thailandensis]|uniref:Mannose-1-phosphate guanylyltransferase n=1 Tax=Paenibacillus thailandensis TaxID=393250 RepID=A0ABW5QX69_9BACL